MVTLEGQPRVIRTLTANVSHKGLFLRMPEPLPLGTKVALSLEAGGRVLGLAQAEVVWGRVHESQLPGRFPGCGLRFTEFMHPRAEELVSYLVRNLDTGKPLVLAPSSRRWVRYLPYAGGGALATCAALAVCLLWSPGEVTAAGEPERAPGLELVAETPTVRPRAVPVPGSALPTGAAAVALPKDLAPTAVAALTPASAPDSDLALNAGGSGATVTVAAPPAARDGAEATSDLAPVVARERGASAGAVAVADQKVAPVHGPSVAAVADEVGAPGSGAVADPARTFAPRNGEGSAAGPMAAEGAGSTATAVKTLVALATKATSVSDRAITSTPMREKATPAWERGTVRLPSGASSKLSWSVTGAELRLTPDATVTRAFLLTNPPRAVFDLEGRAPDRSHQLVVTVPHATGVRVGKQGKSGTRLVIDLDQAPRKNSQDGAALVLSF